MLSFFNVTYGTKIIESEKAIMDYLQSLQMDELSIASDIAQQKSILGDDPLSISRHFNEMIKNFRLYLIYAFVSMVVFTSIIWAITHKLVHKANRKQLKIILFRTFIVALGYLGLIFLFFFSVFSISLTESLSVAAFLLTKYMPFLLISMALFYFMFVSLSLVHNTELKEIIQRTLFVGIRKAHYISAVYIIDFILFIAPSILLFYFIENTFVLLLSIIIFTSSFVFGRILLVNVVEKLVKCRKFSISL